MEILGLPRFFCILAMVVAIAACGGGGGGGSGGGDDDADPGSALSGIAAAGAPVIGTVTVKGSLGNTRSVPIEADGGYDIDVTGLTAPYRLRATGTVGGRNYLIHSYAETTAENLNITPFTDLIVANAAGQIAADYFDTLAPAALDPVELAAQEAALRAKLQSVFSALGIGTAINLLHTAFDADHTGLDAALDLIRIAIDPVLQRATITSLLEGTLIVDEIGDPDDNSTLLGVIDPDRLTSGLADIQAITDRLDTLSAAFAGGLPAAASVEDLFAADFSHEDTPLGTWLTDFTTDPGNIGLTFRSISIAALDSAAGTATVAFNIDFNGVLDVDPVTWSFERDSLLGWQARGDQRIVDAAFGFHCIDGGIYFVGGCGVSTQIHDRNFDNNGTLGAPIASAAVSIMDGGGMAVKRVIYLGAPDASAPGVLRVYNPAIGQFQGDFVGFGAGAGKIDPAIFVAGDIVRYDLYTQNLDVSNPASPQVAAGTEIESYADRLLFTPSLTPLYPDATAAAVGAMAGFTSGDDLNLAWTLAAGTGNSEVRVEIGDNSGKRIPLRTDTFGDAATSLTIPASALSHAAAAAAGFDQTTSAYRLLVRISARDSATGQAHSRDYAVSFPGPGVEAPPAIPFLPLSYAVSATDIVGSTGASAVAPGVPDYVFINDAGVGFGGSSTEVFDVGEVVELAFPTALRNHPGQHDLVISAFVEGSGGTDNATVQVEVSADGSLFTVVDTFNTQDARSHPQEGGFRGVKHFPVEFGAAQHVTHIRLTNLAGTGEGLRLDAVEGLHPVTNSAYAFEVRIEKTRLDSAPRFKIRIKNIGDPGGAPIREWHMNTSETTVRRLDETIWPIRAIDGDFICVTNCIADNNPQLIPFSNHVWSVDGANQAAPGMGLDPGRQAALERFNDFDVDGDSSLYLSGFRFTVTFADGFAHTFDYDDAAVAREIGSLYQKNNYFAASPGQSGNRPVDYYQFVRSAVPANNSPVANADAGSTEEDTPFTTLDVLGNDTDGGDGPGALSITAFDTVSANGGSVSHNGDGTFDYTPAAGFNGADTFTYTVSDTLSTAVGIVTITVGPVNDDPVANADADSTDEDTPFTTLDVLGNDTDGGDGPGPLSITGFDAVSANGGSVSYNGDGTFDYAPALNFNGNDSFTYTVSDGSSTAVGTVTITVNSVNDAPVANADADSTDEDTPLTTLNVLGNDSDGGDGPGALSVTAFDATSTNGGSVAYNGNGSFDYTPASNFNGEDSFTYTVSDGADGAVGLVTITVNPVNDAPAANADADSTDEDTPLTTLDVLGNDTDGGDGPGALSITAFDAVSANGGSVAYNGNGTFDYTPASNFNGSDSFTYTVSDTASSSVGTVTVTVNPVNDDPVANDDFESVPMNGLLITADVLANDTDAENDGLAVSAGDPVAANGIVVNNNDGTFDYTPNPDFFGADSFTYTVNDGNGGSDVGTVNITVIPPDEATVADLLDEAQGSGVGQIDSWNNNLPQFEYWRHAYDSAAGTLSIIDEKYDYSAEAFVDASGFDGHWLTPMGNWDIPSGIDVVTANDGDGSMIVALRDAGDTVNVASFRIRAFTQDIDGEPIADYLDANWAAHMLDPAAAFGAGAKLVTSYSFESLSDAYTFELEDWCAAGDPARYAALGNSCNGVFINSTASYATSLAELQVGSPWVDTDTTDDSGLDAVVVATDAAGNAELLAELVTTGNAVNFYVRDYDLAGADYIIEQAESSTWSLDSVSGVMMIRFAIPSSLQSRFPDLEEQGLDPFFTEFGGFVRGGVRKQAGLITADTNILNRAALDAVLANFDPPSAPEFTGLVGTWVADSASVLNGDPTVFHYFSSYHYEVSGTCDGDGTTGLEYGTLMVDAGDNTFTTSTSVNGRGLCSLADAAGPATTLAVDGDTLTLDIAGQVTTFTRFGGGANPLVGSWVGGDITAGGAGGHNLLTFFDDTSYMHSEDCASDGIGAEYGSYTWDRGGTEQVTSAQVYDANGASPGCGLSGNTGNWEFAVIGDTLTLTVPGQGATQYSRHRPVFVPLSYAVGATDIVGSTGAAAVALGVPDYVFINGAGLGFGSNTDVFDVGEVVELTFPAALRNHPGQHDLVISAYVEGLGGTDNATVQVEASSNGSSFTVIDTFDTSEARSYPPPNQWENDFSAVKHFPVEFGALQNVTHIRLTNLAGTPEGLRLDAVEGLHPVTNSAHAFEVRFERVRPDTHQRFRVRIKNIGDPGGVPIREWTMDRTAAVVRLEDTHLPIGAVDGDFICVTNCVLDNNPEFIPFSHHVWSVDGSTEAAPGLGLDPGRQAIQERYDAFDTDGDGIVYISGFEFTVIFADGFSHTFYYDADVIKEIGSLYQKYLYFSSTPLESWNRPVDYYQFVD